MQDDWHILPRVTVNLGLRYEVQTVLKDRDNKLGNFDREHGAGGKLGKGRPSPFTAITIISRPRVGFAWDVARQWENRRPRGGQHHVRATAL